MPHPIPGFDEVADWASAGLSDSLAEGFAETSMGAYDVALKSVQMS